MCIRDVKDETKVSVSGNYIWIKRAGFRYWNVESFVNLKKKLEIYGFSIFAIK